MTVTAGSGVLSGRRNAHLTYQANVGAGRHGWLRLTPAYSVRLVRERLAGLPAGTVVTDPFSGTGTSALAAAEHGCAGQAVDVNPFLVWLGNAKLRRYDPAELDAIRAELPRITARARALTAEADALWQPPLHNITRWWAPGPLAALKAIRRALDDAAGATTAGKATTAGATTAGEATTAGAMTAGKATTAADDLLAVALCRTVIASSNAAFNHQSMSFRSAPDQRLAAGQLVDDFAAAAVAVLDSARDPLPGTGRVLAGDARQLGAAGLASCDILITSPPYVNRMSYIRELRPYMYWLRYLDLPREAGELDWQAIGGTWGVATSRVGEWAAPAGAAPLPVAAPLAEAGELIRRDGGRNGPLLANYVAKYFHDMHAHFRAAFGHVRSGGRAVYIVGNSSFYGHVIPAQDWYAALLRDAGFADVTVTAVRKRNSNLALHEYEVSATRP